MRAPIILRIFKDGNLVEVKQFDADQVVIGHEDSSQVVLKDDSVSTIHCLIELRDSGYYVCDLGSQLGTSKNGAMILDAPLSSGDKIQVGKFQIQFIVGVPKPVAPPKKVEEETEITEKIILEEADISVVALKPDNHDNIEKPDKSDKFDKSGKLGPVPMSDGITSNIETKKTSEAKAEPMVMASVKRESAAQRPEIPSASLDMSYVKRSSKNFNTFAPKSSIKNLKSHLKPHHGPLVEVIVAWKERIIGNYHFRSKSKAMLGPSGHVFVPSSFLKTNTPFLEIDGNCRVLVPPLFRVSVVTYKGEISTSDLLSQGKMTTAGSGSYSLLLEQEEMAHLKLDGELLQIFVRYIEGAPKPLLAPSTNFTAGEFTGLVVTLMTVALFSLYMVLYTPPEATEDKKEEELRLAQFIYEKKPTPTPRKVEEPPPPPPPKEAERPAPTPMPTPTPEKKVVKLDDKQKVQGKKSEEQKQKQQPAHLAQEVRPKDNKNAPKTFTSTKQGGAVKMGAKEGANAQSTRDVSKTGLLSAFGGGGMRKQLDQAYSGAGEMMGLAEKATGTTGQADDRAGDDLGSKFKDTGAGGKGTATHGISGVNTKGRSSGQSSYGGLGVGGGKGNVAIEVGGIGEDFVGTIDRDAVRRVIQSIKSQVRSCYERQLRGDPQLEGKLVITFVIGDQGRVSSARTKSSTLNNPAVDSCVIARLKEQRFPEPPVGQTAEVSFPFVFKN